jgi:Reverse transcriptase (RNA-dependent DNA polymerase)
VAFSLSNRTVAYCTFWKFFIIYSKLFFGVPQGSVLGPINFSIYVSLFYHIVQSFIISHQQYADDILQYIALSASQPHYGIQHLEQCLLSLLMVSANVLSFNASKSNSILFSTRQRLRNFPPDMHVDFAGCNILIKKSFYIGHHTRQYPHSCVNSRFIFEVYVTYATVLPLMWQTRPLWLFSNLFLIMPIH